MKKTRPAGLVGAGRLNASFLARLPGLVEHLGPIKAQNFRLSRRMANSLRAGVAVKTYEELNHCRLILIAVPGKILAPVVDELARSGIAWSDKSVVLCDALRESSELQPLSMRGAASASLAEIEGFEGSRYVAEGHRTALREIRRVVERGGGVKVFELRPSQKPLYSAGVSFATSLFMPLAEASFECLRKAGLVSGSTSLVVGGLFERSLRAYLKAGKKAWSGPLADGDPIEAARLAEALGRIDPLLKEYFEHTFRHASELLKHGRRSAKLHSTA